MNAKNTNAKYFSAEIAKAKTIYDRAQEVGADRVAAKCLSLIAVMRAFDNGDTRHQ